MQKILVVVKYDSCNKIQCSGYLVDLFKVKDRPREDYQAWINWVQNALKLDHKIKSRDNIL